MKRRKVLFLTNLAIKNAVFTSEWHKIILESKTGPLDRLIMHMAQASLPWVPEAFYARHVSACTVIFKEL